MAYSIDPIQANCYPGTTVLVNKLHIHDEAALQEAEALATYVNASKLEQCPLEGVFDFAHYKAIHQFLFSDLYDWAGQIRTVNISKKGTDFCPAGEIEPQAKLIFDRLKEQNYFKGLPHDAFVEEITDFYCTTNYLHPFREGNGRSMRIWLDLMLKNGIGQVVDWSKVDKEDYLLAMERSPIKDVEIKVLLKPALTDDVNSREVFMKGIDHSYYYEGYATFMTGEL